MKKLIHVLNINDFFPELFALTFPTIKSYAERHGFMINLITERKFPDYPINYEKMQVYAPQRVVILSLCILTKRSLNSKELPIVLVSLLLFLKILVYHLFPHE